MSAPQTSEKRLYQELALQIEEDIKSRKQLKYGDKLPSEREMSDHYSVSRTTVREALIMLELRGLIGVRKGSGVYFRSHEQVVAKPELPSIGPFELLQARQYLESAIASLAATAISASQIRELRAKVSGTPMGEESDRDFHIFIAECTHNNMMITTSRNLWEAKDSVMWNKLIDRIEDIEAHRKDWHEDHHHIVQALMMRSPERAHKAMWLHLENVKNVLFSASDVDDPEFDAYYFASTQRPLSFET
ncbi:GntR family transcriptional regulator [Polycladidibacter hongkongensis]|uniref:GntR family transcriptional regulator n=1 Tax=Polycladidibacter hongkongensis TaxID=1647556 RepID=UPI000835FF61|nr:GntR family transcriptional regulator [Pseudovibrio hongkongensis]